MLIHALVILALWMSPDIDPPPKYKAWIQDHEVWIETSAGDRRVTYDALAAEPAAVSPKGDRVVYAVENPSTDEHCDNTPRQYVALSSNNGSPLWKVGLDNCNEFTAFEWIDERRIGAKLCGHANCFYWVLDAASGKSLQQLTGGFDFLWSHTGSLWHTIFPSTTRKPAPLLALASSIPCTRSPTRRRGDSQSSTSESLPGLPTTNGFRSRKRSIPAATDMWRWSAHKATYCARAFRWMSKTTPGLSGLTIATSRSPRRSGRLNSRWMATSCARSWSTRSERSHGWRVAARSGECTAL